jgi:hypothetical protein
LAELGINVCVLSPGYVRTNLSLNALRPDGSCHAQMDTSTANGMAPDTVAKVGACHTGYAVIAIILPCMFSSSRFFLSGVYFFVLVIFSSDTGEVHRDWRA